MHFDSHFTFYILEQCYLMSLLWMDDYNQKLFYIQLMHHNNVIKHLHILSFLKIDSQILLIN
jgi:hypothetical protein